MCVILNYFQLRLYNLKFNVLIMQFVEYSTEDAKKIVLSWFAAEPSITNEKMLSMSIIADDESELEDFNLYAAGLMKIENASFKFNISAYNIMELLIMDKCVERSDGVQTITEKGKEEIAHYYLNDPQFGDLVKIAKEHPRMFMEQINWKRFSLDMIKVLKLNEDDYGRK